MVSIFPKKKEKSEELCSACSTGNLQNVEKLISKGADVNCLSKSGDTPLTAACKNEHYNVAKLLLEKGADPNQMDNHGFTPLIHACYTEHEQMVTLLIDNHASLNPIDGPDPLEAALNANNANIAKILYNKGASFKISLKDVPNDTLSNISAKLNTKTSPRVRNQLKDKIMVELPNAQGPSIYVSLDSIEKNAAINPNTSLETFVSEISSSIDKQQSINLKKLKSDLDISSIIDTNKSISKNSFTNASFTSISSSNESISSKTSDKTLANSHELSRSSSKLLKKSNNIAHNAPDLPKIST